MKKHFDAIQLIFCHFMIFQPFYLSFFFIDGFSKKSKILIKKKKSKKKNLVSIVIIEEGVGLLEN
jgi:hypothetical protein